MHIIRMVAFTLGLNMLYVEIRICFEGFSLLNSFGITDLKRKKNTLRREKKYVRVYYALYTNLNSLRNSFM